MLDAVLRKLGLLFAALALFSMAGGHWAALQTIAWAEMLREYTAQTGSVALAVEQTFDGEHPCDLCLKIAAAKQREKAKDDASTPDGKTIAKADKTVKAVAPNDALFQCVVLTVKWARPGADVGFLLARTDRPPTPPPRAENLA